MPGGMGGGFDFGGEGRQVDNTGSDIRYRISLSFEEAMKEAKGRIFIIDDDSLSCYNRLENKEEYKQVEIKKFEPKYKEYTYQIVVLEKIK